MKKFLDTNILLRDWASLSKSNEQYWVSSVSLRELERIKSDKLHKDPELRFQARKAIHMIYESGRFNVSVYNPDLERICPPLKATELNDDARIMACAYQEEFTDPKEPVKFYTADLSCKVIAENIFHLDTHYEEEYEADGYSGFQLITCKTEEEMAHTYEDLYDGVKNKLKVGEYLFISDGEEVIDKYVRRKDGLHKLTYQCYQTKFFGKVKPKDCYQLAAIDSMNHNQITMLRGAAGSGKSYLAMTHLFNELERGAIDRIIIFCNTVATQDSAKLGYYPGSREEKLLDSQIGNFLIGKLGDRYAVEEMIEKGLLMLLPMSDIRGFDTTGMKAGVYITEAQNMTVELAKLCLQRIGEDSIVILDGDDKTQVDLSVYAGDNNGLRKVSKIFRNHDFYGEITLQKIYRGRIAELADLM